MASQADITLYPGAVTPEEIVLRSLPAPPPADPVVCYLFPVSSPAVPASPDPGNITLYAGDATPETVVLRIPAGNPLSSAVLIVLRGFGAPVIPSEEPPPPPESPVLIVYIPIFRRRKR
jgi:hypothetical protein